MSNQPVMSLLLNWRLHLFVLLISVFCEWVGIILLNLSFFMQKNASPQKGQ